MNEHTKNGLEEKVAVVTGASKGIGVAIAKRLAAEGAAVIVNYASDRQGAEKVVAQIVAAGGKATAVGADVAQETEVESLFAAAHETYGRLDILVNNAGVFKFGALEDVTAEEFHRQFNINVLGLLLASKAASKAFGDAGGNIINISSGISVAPMPNGSIYGATKGAVDVITRTLAKELGPRGIRVNAVSPGPTETEGAKELGIFDSEEGKAMLAQTPLGRFGTSEDIASVVALLVSPDADWITGQIVQAAGGLI